MPFPPSLHPTPGEPTSLPPLHPPPWICSCVLYSSSCNRLVILSRMLKKDMAEFVTVLKYLRELNIHPIYTLYYILSSV